MSRPAESSSPTHPRIRTFHGRHGRLTDRMRNTWRRLSPRYSLTARTDTDRSLVVEVGCGHGEAALSFAAAHPDIDIVAVDVHTPGVVSLLEAIDARSVNNVFVERDDAVTMLDERIGSGRLGGLHVFFPDPWPKARHRKRRFIRPDLLDLCADRMEPGAWLRFATDADDYADWALDHLDGHPDFDGGVVERPGWRPVTRYEQQAIEAGRPIVDLAFRRVGPSGDELRQQRCET